MSSPSFEARVQNAITCQHTLLLIFLFSLFMYVSRAFSYPWLEDDDPWSHALGINYIAKEKSIRQPVKEQYFQYFDPYPPGYDMLMGILYQTADDMIFTLKFFNALIISFGTIFFFYSAKAFMASAKKALFATFVIAMTPPFLSHFNWALSMVLVLSFVVFYALEKTKGNKQWWKVAAVVTASMLFISPIHSTYFGRSFAEGKKIAWKDGLLAFWYLLKYRFVD